MIKIKKIDWLFAVLIAILLVTAGIAIYLYAKQFHQFPLSGDQQHWGQFSDYFGGLLNPIVSVCTLYVAYRVWALQKIEMAETRKAMKEQAETVEQQRVQQRFFNLLEIYYKTVESMTLITYDGKDGRIEFKGKDVFMSFLSYGLWGNDRTLPVFLSDGFEGKINVYERTNETLGGMGLLGEYIEKELNLDLLKNSWNSLGKLDPYFRAIYRLLKESELLLGSDRHRYVKLLRAQLGSDELILLGFNVWLSKQGNKMIPLMREYGLLKHLPQGHLRSYLEEHVDKPQEHDGRSIFGETYAESFLTSLRNAKDNRSC